MLIRTISFVFYPRIIILILWKTGLIFNEDIQDLKSLHFILNSGIIYHS